MREGATAVPLTRLLTRARARPPRFEICSGTALRDHARALSSAEALGAEAASRIDLKYAAAAAAGCSSHLSDCGMDALHVRITEELVTLGPRSAGVSEVSTSAPHLTPREFHAAAADASRAASTVLIDTRNAYEHAVGRLDFAAEGGAPTLLPPIRQMSDFAAWADAHAERLRASRCLMYCTGGVRCERASAYLRQALGVGEVIQLRGGVHRYLDEFGVAREQSDGNKDPGRSRWKGELFVFDDRVQTSKGSHAAEAEAGSQAPAIPVGARCVACDTAVVRGYAEGGRARCGACRMLVLVCEACSAAGAGGEGALRCSLCASRAAAAPPVPQRKLRVLCLHGFRQTGKQLRGRLARIRGRLGDLVDFRFMDAPHTLLSPQERRGCNAADSEMKGGPKLPPPKAPRRAWLLDRSDFERLYGAGGEADAEVEISAGLWPGQRLGWQRSLAALEAACGEADAPFDGLLGFSQGAAVAAAFVAAQPSRFAFVVLAGGFEAAGAPLGEAASVVVPSLHVIGSADQQAATAASEALAAKFVGARVVRHADGHFMPADKECLASYRDFMLRAFARAEADSSVICRDSL